MAKNIKKLEFGSFEFKQATAKKWEDEQTLKAIVKDIELTLGWKCFLGSIEKELRLVLPIIQKHLKEIR